MPAKVSSLTARPRTGSSSSSDSNRGVQPFRQPIASPRPVRHPAGAGGKLPGSKLAVGAPAANGRVRVATHDRLVRGRAAADAAVRARAAAEAQMMEDLRSTISGARANARRGGRRSAPAPASRAGGSGVGPTFAANAPGAGASSAALPGVPADRPRLGSDASDSVFVHASAAPPAGALRDPESPTFPRARTASAPRRVSNC